MVMSIWDGTTDWRGNPIAKPPKPPGKGTPDPYAGYDLAVQKDEQQFQDSKDQVTADRNYVASLRDEFLNTPNPFFDAIRSGSLLDNPFFQRMHRMNQAASAQLLKEGQSAGSASFGARGIRGDPAAAFDINLKNEALRRKQEADNATLKELTSVYSNAGVARDSVLGSLLNSEINFVGNQDIPVKDYSQEWLDKHSLEQLDKALSDLVTANSQSQNSLLNDPTIKGFYDFAQLLQGFIPGQGILKDL